MTRIAEVENRGAVVAWSPILGQADIIAIGTKDSGGIGFDDYGGELELCDLNITSTEKSPKPTICGKIQTSARFASIGWTPMNPGLQKQYKMGLLAGGMIDGSIHVWDPAMIKSQDADPIVATISQHAKGAVSGLAFNPHPSCAFELASGGSNGEVFITSLKNPSQPESFSLSTNTVGAEITQIAWNTQVSHIVAASSASGTVIVYDTKQRKEWSEIRCETNGMPVTDIAWNPTEGLHIVTASGDDRNPVLKLWDLRSSTTIPLATLQGHNQGILSIGWCPHDAGLLLSCGKDNRTLLWDLYTLQAIYELPAGGDDATEKASPESMYGGSLSTSQQKRYDVRWNPIMRGVVSTCSFDRKVQVHSVIGAATKSGRTPKWMKRPCGVSCGFAGTILAFKENHKIAQIDEYVEEPVLKQASEYFENSIASGDFTGFCDIKSKQFTEAGYEFESTMWSFMRIVFESNAREEILQFLGFESEKISEMALNFKDTNTNGENTTPDMSKMAVDTVKKSLLVGDFEAAVECCFRSGNLADALLLSSCGGADLWAKTQARYFEVESQKRSFLPIVNAVIHNELEELVVKSDPSEWQETLAILSTYGKSEEFPSLCLALGDRLDEAGDKESASLCFMCALNLDKVSKYWMEQLNEANKVSGSTDLLALQAFVEKVTIFLHATDPNTVLNENVAEVFTEYADLLSAQGLLITSAKYCKSDSQGCNELRDRLYRSKDTYVISQILGSPPAFPFNQSKISAAVVKSNTSQSATNGTYQNSQQNYNQQQATTYQQPNNYQAPQEAELPPGWIALQDPGSGNTYYANQTTGETSWEKPQFTPQQQPTMQQHGGSYQNHQSAYEQSKQQQGYDQPQQSQASATPKKLATKYGDGFVTSHSHPELGEQYGNTTTSNPYSGANRPGTAAVTPASSKQSEQEAFDPNAPPPVSEEVKHISDGLLATSTLLSSCIQSSNERKQYEEIQKGVGIFLNRVSRNEIGNEVMSKMDILVEAVQHKDYTKAVSTQKSLVNSHWREHKDWLKGLKFLCQLASKKLH